MATHDYNLANQSGQSFRSDLNNALAAIVSNNSSSTAPATTFAHQIWVDTTANVIKQRNAANDAWVELWRIDGGFNAKTFSSNVTLNAQSDLRFADSDSSNWVAFQAPATVASNVTWTLPSADGSSGEALTTNGSGTLSWASASADAITEGNTSAEVVDTGSDGHFKVVTEGTEALRIDSSQRVGIGETSMDGLLVIKGNSDAASTPSIRLKDGTDTREAWISNTAGDLVLVNGGDDNVPHCKITLFDANTIRFDTANTERMRIDSSGRLLVGTSSTSATESVVLQGNSSGATSYGSMLLARGTSTPSDGSSLGNIEWSDNTHARSGIIRAERDGGTWSGSSLPTLLSFHTTANGASSPTERMRIESNGKIRLQGGNAVYSSDSGRCGIFFSSLTAWLPTNTAGNLTDNACSVGGSSNRMSVIYAGTGTINTSDINLKQDIENLDAAELSVATAIKSLVKKYRFKDAVTAKGDDARIHVGVIAQEVEQAFIAEGLDPRRYALFCEDTLEDGSKRLGVRYNELLAFVIAAL